MQIIKLGGAALTDKQKFETLQQFDMGFVKDRFKKGKLIIVHGAGSFGHNSAKKYKLEKGFVGEASLIGVSKTRQSVKLLSNHLIEQLVSLGIPAISISPGDYIVSKNREFNFDSLFEYITHLLGCGFLPVLHGDVILDHLLGCWILSGDVLLEHLSFKYRAEKCIFLTNVDGVFDKHPAEPEAQLIKEILVTEEPLATLMERHIKSNTGNFSDTTGEMSQKLLSSIKIVKQCKNLVVIGRLKGGRLNEEESTKIYSI